MWKWECSSAVEHYQEVCVSDLIGKVERRAKKAVDYTEKDQ
jgi:hypothetical protein